MVKAAIFMGDPLFKAGLPYNVGTCAAGGVCDSLICDFRGLRLTMRSSSMRVLLGSNAHRLLRSSRTAMLRTHTAAMVTMGLLTRGMGLSMAVGLLLLLRVSWPKFAS
jgi:hypothetical protein